MLRSSCWLVLACILVSNFKCIPAPPDKIGFLTIKGKSPGYYYILPQGEHFPQQITTKKKVAFNEAIPLPIGQYIALSNCSYRSVEIKTDQTTTLLTNFILIDTVGRFGDQDSLNARCSLEPFSTKVPLIPNQALHLFYGNYSIDFSLNVFPVIISHGKPIQRIYTSYIIVNSKHPSIDRFFVYLPNLKGRQQKKRQTISQVVGKKLHLLEGKYIVEINGTKKLVNLTREKPVILQAGSLLVTPPSQEKILHTQPYLDRKHILNFNQLFTFLPGSYKINLGQGNIEKTVKIRPFQPTRLSAAQISVGSGIDCSKLKFINCNELSVFSIHNPDTMGSTSQFQVNTNAYVFPGQFGVGISDAPGILKLVSIKENEYIKLKTGYLRVLLSENKKSRPLVRIEGASEALQGKTPEHHHFGNHYYELLPGEYRYRRFIKPTENNPPSFTKGFVIKAGYITHLKM